MSKFPIELGDTGIPICVVDAGQFEPWLSQQPSKLQAWLVSTGFNGKGTRLVADDQGSFDRVVFGTDNMNDYFLFSELAAALPPNNYLVEGSDDLQMTAAVSWGLGAYAFDRYKKEKRAGQAILRVPDKCAFENATRFVNAIVRVRDLINTPPNDMMPENIAAAVEELASEHDADVSQIIGDDLIANNYPMIHAVGRASAHPPRLIDLKWGNPSDPKVTLVGKGVSFDSGGIDVKTKEGMRLMKKDMGGAAHAIGLAELIMAFNLPIRLRLLIPAVENAIASNAYRPSDVIISRKGITVEVDDTDAEGRLILGDALAEADSESPDLLIDFATLTGACLMGLGTELPALFTNNVSLARELLESSEKVADPLWPLPLHQPYVERMKSNVADLLSRGDSPLGGGITAALFLEHFVGRDTDWVHFDLMAWNDRKRPGRPVGGEAQSIRAVFDYLQHRFYI